MTSLTSAGDCLHFRHLMVTILVSGGATCWAGTVERDTEPQAASLSWPSISDGMGRADEFAKARALVEGEVSKRFWYMASSMAQDKWR